MSVLIIATGTPLKPAEGKMDSAAFDIAVREQQNGPMEPYTGRKADPSGRPVWVGEDPQSAETAKQVLTECEYTTEPLLNEIDVRSFADTEKEYAPEVYFRKAAAQRKQGDPRQKESREQLIRRAEELIGRLEDAGDVILVTGPLFLEVLMDRFRVHGYVVGRSGIRKILPYERMIFSRRDEHCGGCGHNCFLSNPGCGIGKDKALRREMEKKRSRS